MRMNPMLPPVCAGAAWAQALSIRKLMLIPYGRPSWAAWRADKKSAVLYRSPVDLLLGRAKAAGKACEIATGDRLPQVRHELQVEVQVVDGIEPRGQDLARLVEMAQVGTAVVAAGV